MYEYRHALVRMRLGESDRQITKTGLMGRRKLAHVRLTAESQGWLNPAASLPTDAALSSFFASRATNQPSTSSIIPFQDDVRDWVKQGIAGCTIHQALIRKHGFTGAYSSVRRFIAKIKEDTPVATVMLDFAPGDAVQVDFGAGPEITDVFTGEVIKTHFFVMTLAWSRHQYAEIVRDQKIETWLGCHRRAFEFFGGVPARVIIDNPKCAITKACYHDPEVQRSYAAFAEGCGFLVSPCPPRDPQKKGRVESGVKYIKNNFMPLRDFRSLRDANEQLRDWVLGIAGNRIHGTTKEQPLALFAETEKHILRPLPDVPLELAVWAKVKLHGNCHVEFRRCYYSAPYRLVRQTLWLRATEITVQIFYDNELVAIHSRLSRPGSKATVQEHQPPEAQAYIMHDPQWCLAQAEKVGLACRECIDALFSHKVLDNLRAAQGTLQLKKKYGAKRLEAACRRALDHHDPRYNTVKRILEKGLDVLPRPVFHEEVKEVYRGKSKYCRELRGILQ
jgi:transposase